MHARHPLRPARPTEVLAIHGLTGHGQRWQTLATQHLPEFARRRTGSARPRPVVVGGAVDASTPTSRRWRQLLDAEAERPVLVVGHSFGGAVALNLAAARPDLVAALVLLDPAVGLDGGWMREIADDMLASPDYTDREEARAEKANGSWGEVDAAELERELDEHLDRAARRPMRVADQHSGDDVVLERAGPADHRCRPTGLRRRWCGPRAPIRRTSPTNSWPALGDAEPTSRWWTSTAITWWPRRGPPRRRR